MLMKANQYIIRDLFAQFHHRIPPLPTEFSTLPQAICYSYILDASFLLFCVV